MQQQCVYFHTDISIEKASEILKEQGWEIIFKSHHDDIDFDTLTEGEKISWIDDFEERIKRQTSKLQKHDRKDGSFIISTDQLKQRFEKLSFMLKNSQLPITEKFEIIVSEMRTINAMLEQISTWMYHIFERGYPEYEHQIQCARIIAKKGSEQIRYLEYDYDPIITITGPNANSSKASIEGKF